MPPTPVCTRVCVYLVLLATYLAQRSSALSSHEAQHRLPHHGVPEEAGD